MIRQTKYFNMYTLPDNLAKLDTPMDKKPNPKRMSIYLTEMSEKSIRIDIRVQILFEESNMKVWCSKVSVF